MFPKLTGNVPPFCNPKYKSLTTANLYGGLMLTSYEKEVLSFGTDILYVIDLYLCSYVSGHKDGDAPVAGQGPV